MTPSVLPQFVDPRDPQSVFVANQLPDRGTAKSVVSTGWFASAEISIPATERVIYMLSLVGYNKGAAQWLHIFDLADLPADGASTAVMILNLPANSMFYADIPYPGLGLLEGLVIAVSTTEATLTLGATDIKFTAIMRNVPGGV